MAKVKKDRVVAVSFDFSFLNKLTSRPRRIISLFLEMVLEDVAANMVREAPVDEGKLSGNIGVVKFSDFIWGVLIDVAYWRPVQFGSRPHIIRPKNAKVLRFETKGNIVFAKFVNHPGTEPNPFIDRAMDLTRPRIGEFLETILRRFA